MGIARPTTLTIVHSTAPSFPPPKVVTDVKPPGRELPGARPGEQPSPTGDDDDTSLVMKPVPTTRNIQGSASGGWGRIQGEDVTEERE